MDSAQVTGMVADIQRFSVHDGFGIRTSVFLKGCNMRCAWCHNPETIAFEPEVLFDPDKCIGCGQCAKGCFSGAKRVVGQEMSAVRVMDEVLMDKAYYGADGGMTLTGGEPSCQLQFARALLTLARDAGVHTAIETNLNAPREALSELLPLCDLIMCDVKLWDREQHRHWTGADNIAILENLRFADSLGVPILVRTPLVPGVNDEAAQILPIAALVSGLKNALAYELLPYHALGASKSLQGEAAGRRFETPDKQKTLALAKQASASGIQVRVAGIQIEGV